MGYTDRIQRLKDNLLRLSLDGWRHRDPMTLDGIDLESKDSIDTNTRESNLLTIMGQEGIEKEPIIIRKAKAIEKTLLEIPVRIAQDELIVGSTLLVWKYCCYATPEERKKYAPLVYNNNTLYPVQIPFSTIKEERIKFMREKGYDVIPGIEFFSWGHTTAGFKKVLEKGFIGISEDAKRRLDEENASVKKNVSKCNFWQTVIIVSNAMAEFAKRYAEKALLLAYEETNEIRKEELKKIAKICSRVPWHPAQTFQEAIQSIWFTLIITQRYVPTDLGRFDQYMCPYYEKDIKQGLITKELAQELIDCIWLKLAEFWREKPKHMGLMQSVILSGKTSHGQDGTNDITYMCLDATDRFRFPTPKVSVRIHKGTPEELYQRCLGLLRSGLSMPDFYNDDVIIPAFQKFGVPKEDACEYVQNACMEILIGGMSEDRVADVCFLPLRSLELALNNGVSLITGKQEGPRTGEPDFFYDFEELMSAFEKQILHNIEKEVKIANESERYVPKLSPQPLHSTILTDCVEKGKDSTEGGARYNKTGTFFAVGLANTADALIAIKKLVFDVKRFSLGYLVNILKNNFEDNEALRLEILTKLPKYGNDDDEVDNLAKRIVDIYVREIPKHKNTRGGYFKLGAWGTIPVDKGKIIGASADGRKSREPLSINISPVPGRDRNGPTAVIKSASKLNVGLCTNGSILGIELHPNSVAGQKGLKVFQNLVECYFQLGGMSLQFNIMDIKVLREAQKEPHKYKNLQVRVWGYSDYFVCVDPEMQEHIIARTIHGS
jgi:formate C-acetyltransferase